MGGGESGRGREGERLTQPPKTHTHAARTLVRKELRPYQAHASKWPSSTNPNSRMPMRNTRAADKKLSFFKMRPTRSSRGSFNRSAVGGTGKGGGGEKVEGGALGTRAGARVW